MKGSAKAVTGTIRSSVTSLLKADRSAYLTCQCRSPLSLLSELLWTRPGTESRLERTRARDSIRRLSQASCPSASNSFSLTRTKPQLCKLASSPSFAHTSRRWGSSSSSTRWKARQASDPYSREAKLQGLKSRAAFKLIEMDEKYRLFRPGNTVVDLGFAPGSWSQVAVKRTAPRGRVIGIDVLPVQPPRGVSTIQGNFLSPYIQEEVRNFVRDPERGRPSRCVVETHEYTRSDLVGDDLLDAQVPESEPEIELQPPASNLASIDEATRTTSAKTTTTTTLAGPGDLQVECEPGTTTSADSEIQVNSESDSEAVADTRPKLETRLKEKPGPDPDRVVDVVLSDMSAPWPFMITRFTRRSVSDPYNRMMNTSGIMSRDHLGSMELCFAALTFCFDTLRPGGNFVCKFYQGREDKFLERRIRALFERVYREKPGASRSASRENFFVGLRRRADASREDVLGDWE